MVGLYIITPCTRIYVIYTLYIHVAHTLYTYTHIATYTPGQDQPGQDAALREEGLQQKDQEGRQGRPVALRRGQVRPEGSPGHVSNFFVFFVFLSRHPGAKSTNTCCALVVVHLVVGPPRPHACLSAPGVANVRCLFSLLCLPLPPPLPSPRPGGNSIGHS